VLDGEILGWKDEKPLPFAALQKRITRKTVPAKLLRDTPVILYSYDLLELNGEDLRESAFSTRRAQLEALLQSLPETAPIRLSPSIEANTWEQLATHRAQARDKQAEGLMLKRCASPYLAGRKKGDWWKWKLDPLTIDAVMIYAQSGHGRRANLFTDYTFAVWNGNDLVPFTKAYSGLSDAEFRQITAWVRQNTLQRDGAECANHEQRAVGKVDHAQRPKDQCQAKGDQRICRALVESVQNLKEDRVHVSNSTKVGLGPCIAQRGSKVSTARRQPTYS